MAKEMLSILERAFATATLGTAYTEFKVLLEMRIPEDQGPAPTIAKIKAHVEKLEWLHVEISPYIMLMLLLTKTPT